MRQWSPEATSSLEHIVGHGGEFPHDDLLHRLPGNRSERDGAVGRLTGEQAMAAARPVRVVPLRQNDTAIG